MRVINHLSWLFLKRVQYLKYQSELWGVLTMVALAEPETSVHPSLGVFEQHQQPESCLFHVELSFDAELLLLLPSKSRMSVT